MLIERVLNIIKENNLIKQGDNVLVGVSGGPDSMCLLDILIKLQNILNFNLSVAHINHMIRDDANLDEKYVLEFCIKKNIKIYSKKIDIIKIANEEKKGIEEVGRTQRYKFFEEIFKENNFNKIAIAHNKNDLAETIIMNILRGSGITGLKGIEINRDNKYIRPLLKIERKEIENYCLINKLNPRIDTTNQDNKYTRNKIRNVIVPYLQKEFNPNIISSFERLSEIILDEHNYMEKCVIENYKDILCKENEKEISVDLKKFNNLHIAIKSRMIFFIINKIIGNTNEIDKINIEDIIKLCENNIGNKYLTPNKYIKILIKCRKIFFIAI